MWKFKSFSSTQILREIKFGNFYFANNGSFVDSQISRKAAEKYFNFHTVILQLIFFIEKTLFFRQNVVSSQNESTFLKLFQENPRCRFLH